MPSADRMLALVKQATELVRRTRGRRGFTVDLQDCDEILVAGDLHGNVPNFQAIWKLAELMKHPRRHLVVQELIHGKFMTANGGEKSHQLVDLFAAARCQYPDRVHFLPGNHEMAQWTNRPIVKGDHDLNALFKLGIEATYGNAMMPAIYDAYCELFRVCPLALRTANRIIISHTLPPAKTMAEFAWEKLQADSLPMQDYEPGGLAYGILWGRDTGELNCMDYLKRCNGDWLISGHIPSDAGFGLPNTKQVSLDCSAVPGGYVLVSATATLGGLGAFVGVV